MPSFSCDVRSFDLFGYDPTYKQHKFKTLCGSVVTMLMVFLIVGYAWKSTHRFLWEPPRMLSAAQSMDTNPVPMLKNWKFFFFTDGRSFYDETYFSFVFKQFKKGEKRSSEYTNLGLRNCTYMSEYVKQYSTVAKCPKQRGYLYANEEHPGQVMINMEMSRCTGRPECKSPEEIDRLVESGVLVLHFQEDVVRWMKPTSGLDVDVGQRDRAFTWMFRKGATVHSNMYFTKKNITIHSRFAPWIFEEEYKQRYSSLYFDYRQDYVLDFDQLYADVIFLLAEDMIVENHVPETILDLLGRWGGAWGFFAGVLGSVMLCYTRRQCRHHHLEHTVTDMRLYSRDYFDRFGRVRDDMTPSVQDDLGGFGEGSGEKCALIKRSNSVVSKDA